MQFVMLDLMPLLWGTCALIALLLLFGGRWGIPVRIIPAACVAVCLHFLGYPPRLQSIVFVIVYALTGISWFWGVSIRERQKRRPSSHIK